MKKAQSSLEFMYAVLFILFMVVVIASVAGERIAEFKREKDVVLLKDVTSMVKNEINVAHAMGTGYVRSFEIPLTLEGADYDISINSGFLESTMGEQEITAAIPPVTGVLIKGVNVIRTVEGNVTLN